MGLLQEDIYYFGKGKIENDKFWTRFGGRPDLIDRTVLDIGCGHGSLCVDMGLAGAKKIIGIDTDECRINFAKENLEVNFPQLKNVIEFKALTVKDYKESGVVFDYIVSKDTLEHIIDLEENLFYMNKLLKTDAKIYAGFGPLYRSPFGDHGRTKMIVPWGHLMLPEKIIIKRLNRILKKTKNLLYDFGYEDPRLFQYQIKSIYDLGLNGMSLSDYLMLFRKTGFVIVDCRVNQSQNPMVKIISLLRMIPFLKEYCTLSAYCVLSKAG